MLVGLDKVKQLLMERVGKWIGGSVDQESLVEEKRIQFELWTRTWDPWNITGVAGSWAASLSIDMRGVMPVPPPKNTFAR